VVCSSQNLIIVSGERFRELAKISPISRHIKYFFLRTMVIVFFAKNTCSVCKILNLMYKLIYELKVKTFARFFIIIKSGLQISNLKNLMYNFD
jgi:hypothetical protein